MNQEKNKKAEKPTQKKTRKKLRESIFSQYEKIVDEIILNCRKITHA